MFFKEREALHNSRGTVRIEIADSERCALVAVVAVIAIPARIGKRGSLAKPAGKIHRRVIFLAILSFLYHKLLKLCGLGCEVYIVEIMTCGNNRYLFFPISLRKGEKTARPDRYGELENAPRIGHCSPVAACQRYRGIGQALRAHRIAHDTANMQHFSPCSAKSACQNAA